MLFFTFSYRIMKNYIVNSGNFEKFYTNNFTKLIDNKIFTIKYKLFDGYVIRHYMGFEVEGMSLKVGEDEDVTYIAIVVHNEEKIRQIRFLKTLIENQKRHAK